MTKQEFMEKYGSVKVKFDSYYKFTFTYKAMLEDGSVLTVGLGGDADNIYRFEMCNNEEETVLVLDPYMGSVIVDGQEVDEFYDY